MVSSFKDYFELLETWAADSSMDVTRWLVEVRDTVALTQLAFPVVIRKKVKGITLAWFERWLLDNPQASWKKFELDFKWEVIHARTAASTKTEISAIKQYPHEDTDAYILRMKTNVKLLLAVTPTVASPTGAATQQALTAETEEWFSDLFCVGLTPGHPFKRKNGTPPKTLEEAYLAVGKYGAPNRYRESTFDDKIREKNLLTASVPASDVKEVAGTKIPVSQYQEFRKDFPDGSLKDLEVAELTNMFEAWTLASMEESTSAGRTALTVARMTPTVARRVFGSTALARHIAVREQPEVYASRHITHGSGNESTITCHKCGAVGHMMGRCPLVKCYTCGKMGHTTRFCDGADARDGHGQQNAGNLSTTAQAGSIGTSATVGGHTLSASMKVQSVVIENSMVATRTQRYPGASGSAQQRRQERVNLPTGPSSTRQTGKRAEPAPVSREMEWEEPEELFEHEAIVRIAEPELGSAILPGEPTAKKPRKARVPVNPDPEFVAGVESLAFSMGTIAKHRGRMASQLKAAVGKVWKGDRPVRSRKRVTITEPHAAEAIRAKAQPLPSIVTVSRRALGDVAMVTVGGRSFHNAVIDPGNDRTMMGLHVARALGIEPKPCKRGILLADGRFDHLAGVTGVIDFEVKGIAGRMEMGIIDCKESYDFLLGDDWLMFVKAKASWEGGKHYWALHEGRRVYLGATPSKAVDNWEEADDDDSDDYETDDSDDEEDTDEELGEEDEGEGKNAAGDVHPSRSFRLQSISVQDPGIRAFSATTIKSVPNEKLAQFKVGDVTIDINPALSPKKRQDVIDLLEKHRDRFTMDINELEVTTVLEHEVNVKPGSKPVYVGWSKRYAPKELEFLRKSVTEELAAGKIVEMDSEWCAPLTLATKKDGSFRKCVAYVGLNKVTERESWPLPNIEQILDELGGHRYYSSLDGFQGYYVIGIKKEHVKYLGFRTPFGTYAYTVMPFGLKNAPHTFSRFVQKVYGNLIGATLNAYMDDVCNRNNRWDDHIAGLDKTFDAARVGGVKYKATKVHFGYDKVEFMGHIVGRKGIEIMPEKVDKVRNFKVMRSKEAVRAFLGLTGYQRRFIKNYARKARPLTRLLRKGARFRMGARPLRAMRRLQKAITTAPVIMAPKLGREYEMSVDACTAAAGSVLKQQDDNGRVRPVFFYSKTFSGPELNYSTYEKECLAIVYSVKKFRPYILGVPVVVYTDHAPLQWLLSHSDLTGRPARWQMTLAEYDLTIKAKPGKKNGDADGMSRMPVRDGLEGDDIDDDLPECLSMRSVSMDSKWALSKWYGYTFLYLTTGSLILEDYNEARRIRRRAYRFRIDDERGLLYRDVDYVEKNCVVEDEVVGKLERAHDHGGHYGAEATLATIRAEGWWPTMRKDVFDWVKSCSRCQQFGPRRKNNELHPTDAELPFEILFVDLIEDLPKTDRGYTSVVVFSDAFTKWTEACPIPDKTAISVMAAFYQRILCRFGLPVVIRSDGGPAFRTEFKKLCERWGIRHAVGSTRHPQSQGQVEAANKLIEDRLRRSVPSGLQWDLYLPKAMYDVNSRVVGSIKMSPSEALMGFLGRSALRRSFDNDLWFSTTGEIQSPPEHRVPLNGVVASFVCRREGIRELAYQNRMAANERMKRYYDRRVRVTVFEVGELVYVFNLAFVSGLGRKLAPRWLGPFEVQWASRSGAYGVKTGRTHYGTRDGVETLNGDMLKKAVMRREFGRSE